MGAQPFNYTDAIDALPNSIRAYSSVSQLAGANKNTGVIDTDGLFQSPSANSASGAGAGQIADSAKVTELDGAFPAGQVHGVSDAGAFVLAETALKMHCWGENPVVTAKLQLNGQDRFSEREGSYFDLVQPFQHHTRTPDTGINVYSFALRPEEHQPSGTSISVVLTTPHFNWLFPLLPSAQPTLPKFAYMPLTTTFFV